MRALFSNRLGLALIILSLIFASQTFHRSDGGTVHADAPLAELVLYDDALQNGFSTSSWNTPAPNTSYTGQVFQGSFSLQKNLFISGGSGEFMAIHRDSGFNTGDYTHIDFYARSISPEGAKVKVRFAVQPWEGSGEKIDIDIPSGQWTHFSIPFEDFGPNVLSRDFDGIAFSGGGAGAPSNDSDNNVAFDNARLVKLTDNAAPQLLSAEALGQDLVNVKFSEKIGLLAASLISNYVVTSTTDANYTSGRSPASAELLSNGLEVRLTFATNMQDGHAYKLTVSNLLDLSGNLLAANSQVSFSVSISSVTLSVNASNEVYPFNDMMRGVATNNWNWLWHGLWDRPGTCCVPGKRDAIIEATKLLKPGIIRFAGGLWANNVGWDRTGSSPEDGGWTYTDSSTSQTYNYGHKYTPQMVDAFADFASQVGAEAVIQMNVCDNNPRMWADLLRYTNIEKGYNFKYWELGNEQTLDPCGLDAASYAQRYASYRAALKAVDPSIRMLGPVAHMPSYPGWEDTLVSTVGNDVDVLTWHWYQLTEWTSDGNAFAYEGGSVDALFAHDGNVGTTCHEGFGCTSAQPKGGNIDPGRLSRWTYRRGIGEAKLNQVNQYRVANPTMETAITEFGPHAVLHEHPINSNHVAAIWLADVLPRHAYNGLDIVTYYSLEDGSTGDANSRGLLGTWDNDFIDVRPIYYTEYMFAKYFGDMMVESSTSDPKQMVVVWASTDSDDPGTLKLMLVNFNGTASQAKVNVAGFNPVSGQAYEMTSTNPLSMDDPRSFTQHDTTINGVKIPDFDIDNPSTFRNAIASIQPRAVPVSASFSYNIPAYSAVSIVLRNDSTPPPPPPSDTTAPTLSNLKPSGALAAGTTQATLSLNTNEAATCRYGTAAGVAYASMTNTFSGAGSISHSANVTGVQNGQSYTYNVRCQDTAGNANSTDTKITFNVASPAADTTAPILSNLKPSGTLSAGTTQATLSLNTNEAATCRYSTSAGVAYGAMTNTVGGAGSTTHTANLTGLQNGQSYTYNVRCQDTSGNANTSDSKISFSVASATTAPPSAQAWPAKVDLSIGESYTYTLMNGTQRTLKLLSYNIVIPRHKIEATVQISGNGKTETHKLEVAYAGVPVSINGLRVYAYAWKEANDFGFEEVGITGSFPMTSGKDVGFALSDASATMFPDMNDFAYPVTVAFHEGSDFQSFLEPTGDGDETQWAHAGYDIKLPSDGHLLALTNGRVWYQLNGDPNSQGTLWIAASTGDKWTDPMIWLWSHVKGDSATVPEGTWVTKGTPLAQKCSTCGGFHMGSKGSFDFGAWMFAQEVWNYQHSNDFPAPRHWLVLGPYSGTINDNHIYTNESGNLPSTLAPEEGALDKDNSKKWLFRDNLVNSVVHMEELLSVSPFSGNSDRKSKNAVAYAATYIFSPDNHTTDNKVWLKWGSNHNAKIWLNGNLVFTKGTGALVVDEFDVPLPLKKGWNTLIIKTSNDSGNWRLSPKIGDINGNRIPGIEFSARDIDLKVSSVSDNHIAINWSDPGFTGTFVETYRLDVATDEGFNSLVVNNQDLGKVTSYTITGLNSGQDYYIRVKPYSYSEMGGSIFWHHVDSVSARTEGDEKVLPSINPPGGLDPKQVPLFITIGSDDNNDKDGVNFLVDELLGGKLNPAGTGNPATFDGTPLKGTFYLIGVHETFSSGLCDSHRNAYLKGHEIGNHAYENEGGFNLAGWLDSITKANAYISRATGCGASLRGVGVPADEIYGFRAPQDSYNNDMYLALEQLGFTYAASTAVGRKATEDGTNLPWPGTLDQGYPLADWQKQPGVHPGFWELPQTVMYLPPQLGGGTTGYCDLDWFFEWSGDPNSSANIAAMLKHNLDLHLNGNRSPLHLCLHGDAWGKKSWEAERSAGTLARQAALQEFIEYALAKPQVRIVRQIDVINWMRNPVPLGVSGDETAPTAPQGLTANVVGIPQINLSWMGANDPESGVSKYNVYRNGVNIASVNTTSYSDTDLQEGATYTYQVSAVNGFNMEGNKSASASATTLTDNTAPTIVSVSASGNPGAVTVVFSEPVDQTTATNKANYGINNGISVASATLGSDLKTVTLSTLDHSEGVSYTLSVNNVKDRAKTPNTIAPNTQKTYSYSPVLVISGLSVASGKTYQVVDGGLANGAVVYIDRGFTFLSVPAELQGSTYIKTANDDKARTDAQLLSFSVNQNVTVYVAYDTRATARPQWMSDWTDTGLILGTSDVNRKLYSKQFPVSTVALGANMATSASGAQSNYSVIIVGNGGSGTPPPPPSETATLSAQNANANEGQTIAVPIVLNKAPNGLAGFNLRVKLSNSGIARIVSVDMPGFDSLENTIESDTSARFAGVDNSHNINAGGANVTLAIVNIQGINQGSVNVLFDSVILDDDAGFPIEVQQVQGTVNVKNLLPVITLASNSEVEEQSEFFSNGSLDDPGGSSWTATVDYGDGSGFKSLSLNGKSFVLSHVYGTGGIYTITVKVKDNNGDEGVATMTVNVKFRFPMLPGMKERAKDLTGDGRAEDLNGNNRLDFADIVALFEHFASPEIQNNASKFDFNDNGLIDMADIKALFDKLVG